MEIIFIVAIMLVVFIVVGFALAYKAYLAGYNDARTEYLEKEKDRFEKYLIKLGYDIY